MSSARSPVPHRQIRAVFDEDTVTVYQAYSDPIATAAVEAQRLNASPLFKHTRMTWIKPSWCWMLYRAGYGLKDKGQARILALKLTRAGFESMLRTAELSHAPEKGELKGQPTVTGAQQFRKGSVRVQWDPERGPKLQKYEHRSIQIGVPPQQLKEMVSNWIVSIEDVTERALGVKEAVEANKAISIEELVASGLMPMERAYPVPSDIAEALRMDLCE